MHQEASQIMKHIKTKSSHKHLKQTESPGVVLGFAYCQCVTSLRAFVCLMLVIGTKAWFTSQRLALRFANPQGHVRRQTGLARKVMKSPISWLGLEKALYHCVSLIMSYLWQAIQRSSCLSPFSGLQRNRFRQRMPQFHILSSLRNKHIISAAITNNSKK